MAYRMLGSLGEVDDAVQEAWLRLSRSDTSAVENLRGWLTTVVARVCVDMLRARKSRREEPEVAHVPDPIVTRHPGSDTEHQVLLADSIGLALIVVLEELDPAERVAFVLHDMFAVSFEEIAPIVGRTSTAARQLASRARRRVQGTAPALDADPRSQRAVVDAFLAASQRGDFAALLAVLDPDVVLRGDRGPLAPAAASRVVRGASEVAKGVVFGAARAAGMQLVNQPVLVNGSAGVVVFADGKPYSVIGVTVIAGKIAEINVLADPARLSHLDLGGVAAGS